MMPVREAGMIILKRRRQHFKTVPDGGAGIAAKACDRIELRRIDPHALRVDDIRLKMREYDLAENDLARFAEIQRHVTATFEGGRRFLDPRRGNYAAWHGRQSGRLQLILSRRERHRA